MSDELSRADLSSLITHKKGFAFKSKDYIPSGIPVVRVSNFTWDSITSDDLRYVSHTVTVSNKVVQLNENDVIVATVGSWPQNPASIVGKVVRVPRELSGALLNQNTVRLRVIDENPINQKYLYIALKTKEFSEHLVSRAQGSANQASITLSDIFSYAIPWGTYPQREYIVNVIDSINSKIAMANQVNHTLEQMAHVLFKSWFVDFDPVKAKIAVLESGGSHDDALLAAMTAISGKDGDVLAAFEAEHPEQYAELKATAELFPSAMQDSELGIIPEGWVSESLGTIIEPKKGKNITRKTIKIGDVPVIAGGLTPAYYHNKHNVTGPVITISASGANAGFVNLYHCNIWASDCSYISREQTKFVYVVYTLLKLRQSEITHMQQGAAQPHVYPKDLMRLIIQIPPDDLWKKMEDLLSPIYQSLGGNIAQNASLASVRDTLLPKLLSGEITLSEAESSVNEMTDA